MKTPPNERDGKFTYPDGRKRGQHVGNGKRASVSICCSTRSNEWSLMLVFSTRKLTTALTALAMAFGFATTAISQARTTEPLAAEQLLARSREGVRGTYIVSFGLFGPESVFASEAEKAAQILRARLQ